MYACTCSPAKQGPRQAGAESRESGTRPSSALVEASNGDVENPAHVLGRADVRNRLVECQWRAHRLALGGSVRVRKRTDPVVLVHHNQLDGIARRRSPHHLCAASVDLGKCRLDAVMLAERRRFSPAVLAPRLHDEIAHSTHYLVRLAGDGAQHEVPRRAATGIRPYRRARPLHCTGGEFRLTDDGRSAPAHTRTLRPFASISCRRRPQPQRRAMAQPLVNSVADAVSLIN